MKDVKFLIITTTDMVNGLNQRVHHLQAFLDETGFSYTLFSRAINNNLQVHKILVPDVAKVSSKTFQVIAQPIPHDLDIPDIFTLYRGVKKHIKEKYPICLAVGPWAGIVALMLKKRKLVKFVVYEDLDFFPDFYNRGLSQKIVGKMEFLCLKHSDLIITVGDELAGLRCKQTDVMIEVIPNGVTYPTFKIAQDKINHPPTLLYSGTISKWSGVLKTIKAIRLIRQEIPDIRYLILGEGESEEELKEMIASLGLEESVLFLGKKHYKELPKYMREADIGVTLFEPRPLSRYAFPLKVIEYMAGGLMIIGTDIGETSRIIKKYKCGQVISYTEEDFAKAVVRAFKAPILLKEYQVNGSQAAINFDWPNLFKKQIQLIQNLFNS